jgi:hypothetical protein
MWHASLHGSTDHLDPEVAQEIETKVRDALAQVMGTLVPDGHQGVAGSFEYSKGGPSDLRGPGAPTHTASPAEGASGQVAVGAASDAQVPDESAAP